MVQLDSLPRKIQVFVAGAGVMGTGIAQFVAQSGHTVYLYDCSEQALQTALETLTKSLHRLAAKKKITNEQATQVLSRIQPTLELADAASAALIIEAVVEKHEIKVELFQKLEEIISSDCILATNTSSLSVTSIGNCLKHPERLVGMHFFNPAPVMKLVEVIRGMHTSPIVAEQAFELARSWQKKAVYVRSTPGFIVNRIARPFYAEALALLQDQVLEPAQLDHLMRMAGFRMGPCELMDLIGHDTNYQVTTSMFEANYFDRRFTPSLVQKSLIDAGFLGRKSGRGFYDYSKPVEYEEPEIVNSNRIPSWGHLYLRGESWVADHFHKVLEQHGVRSTRDRSGQGCQIESEEFNLRLTDGRLASQIGKNIAVFDLPIQKIKQTSIAVAVSNHSSEQLLTDAMDWLRLFGFVPMPLPDTSGLVVARTIAMLINEAADAVQHGVCSEQDADIATRYGLNFPGGPFEWLNRLSVEYVSEFIDNLDRVYRGERYRLSPWLLQRRSFDSKQRH